MTIKVYKNWAGNKFLVYDDGNEDSSHFEVQADEDNVITSVKNNHTGFMAMVSEEDQLPILRVYKGASLSLKGPADKLFDEKCLEKPAATAVQAVIRKFPDIHFPSLPTTDPA